MTKKAAPAAPATDVSDSDSDPADRSIIVDLWSVPDGSQDEFMDALVGVFERLREFDGFLDGQILRGVDPTRFVSYATMRSARERDAVMADPEFRAAALRIGGIARPRPHAYSIARTFTPAASEPAG
jgi:heme-degrading monooxygenase HmoA